MLPGTVSCTQRRARGHRVGGAHHRGQVAIFDRHQLGGILRRAALSATISATGVAGEAHAALGERRPARDAMSSQPPRPFTGSAAGSDFSAP